MFYACANYCSSVLMVFCSKVKSVDVDKLTERTMITWIVHKL